MKLEVMSYNIRLGIQQGLEAIAEVIDECAPDIVALQEVGRHWTMGPDGDSLRSIAESCGFDHLAYAPCIHSLAAQYGHGLLSRWPIEAPRIVRLARVVDEPRAMLVSRVVAEGAPVDVISTHLSHVEDRERQGPELTELASTMSTPSLVLGDLNEADSVPWLDRLLETHSDAFEAFEEPLPTFPADEPSRRIDYLLGSGGTWRNARVLSNSAASDHRAIAATFEMA